MTTLQEITWMVLYREPDRTFRLVEIVDEAGKFWTGHLGSAAVNTCLDRLIRAGDVTKSTAPNGASLFKVNTPTR
jgi:hypothetical protein